MQELPSKETIKTEVLKELDKKDVPRMCSNCVLWDRASSRCSVIDKLTQSFMTCPNHEFKTEKFERETLEYLQAEKLECEKIENLLALAITCSNLTTCLIEDFEMRTRKLYDREKEKRTRQLLRKDLTMGEDIDKAMKAIEEHLRKIDQQYRFYIQPRIDYMFTGKDKKYDVEKSDQHLNNSLEFGRLFLYFTIKCIDNKENCDKVFELLESMQNDAHYGLTMQDAEHYRLRD